MIGGYTAPTGARSHFGALLVGAWDGDHLRYAGKVGTGFTERTLADLMRRVRPLVRPTSPFADHVRERATPPGSSPRSSPSLPSPNAPATASSATRRSWASEKTSPPAT